MTIEKLGSTPGFLATDNLLEPAAGEAQLPTTQVRSNRMKPMEQSGADGIRADTSEMSAYKCLELHNAGQRTELPWPPMFRRVREQGVAGEQTQVGRHGTEVQRRLVHDLKLGIIPDRPATGPGAVTEIDIFVIKEEVSVESTELLKAGAAKQEATARHPGDLPALAGREQMIFPSSSRQRQARERS
jgi:hypothetical protein